MKEVILIFIFLIQFTYGQSNSCTYQITTLYGKINSPNYPHNYPSMMDCTWLFTTTFGRGIKLVFNDLDLEVEDECDYDWIAIYDGDSNKSPMVGKFCGRQSPRPVLSSGNKMYMEFKSDSSIQRKGFKVTHSTGRCTHQITKPFGEISSPNYPNNYPSMMDCVWLFTTGPGHIIKLVFNHFDLEPYEECTYDWITIYDGNNTESSKIGTFCGRQVPDPIQSTSNKMYLVFKSDDSIERRGFKITHLAI